MKMQYQQHGWVQSNKMMAPEEGEIIEESGECVAPTTVELEDPETRNDELNLEDEASK